MFTVALPHQQGLYLHIDVVVLGHLGDSTDQGGAATVLKVVGGKPGGQWAKMAKNWRIANDIASIVGLLKVMKW